MSLEPTEAFTQAMHDLAPEVEAVTITGVVAGSVLRGKRRRRNRTGAQITGSMAAVVLFGAAGAHTLGGGSGRADGEGRTTATSSAADTSFISTVPGQETLAKALKAMLPGATVSTKSTPPRAPAGASLTATVGDLPNIQYVGIAFAKNTPRVPFDYVTCGPSFEEPVNQCTATTLPDGTLVVERLNANSGAGTGLSVIVDRPDGLYVAAYADAQGDRDVPAASRVTMDRLTTLAENPAWTALARPNRFTLNTTNPDAPTADIAAKVKPLLPAGLIVDDAGLNPRGVDYNADLDDGHGKVLMRVYINPRDALLDAAHNEGAYPASVRTCSTAQLAPGNSCVVEALPDGSTLKVDGGIGDDAGGVKGVNQWEAVVLTRSKTVIRFTEYDSNTPTGAAVRATPPITLAQLRAIATSPVWDQYK